MSPLAKQTKSVFGYFVFKRSNVFAFFLYAFFSWFYLARGASLTRDVWGPGPDPFIFIWSLAWWPWAVAHHLPLLHTDLLWRPEGVFTFWVTSVPLLAAVMAPVTLWAGPVVSYNLLVAGAPVLSGWVMYRLARRLGLGVGAAWLSGYLFGFSSYQMAQASALNLAFTVFVPALAWVVVARWQNAVGWVAGVVLAALCLVGQFLVSLEVFALMVLFGGVFWGVAWAMVADWRGRLAGLAVEGFAAGGLAGLALSPVLFSMFLTLGFLHLPDLWTRFFDADVLATVWPSARIQLGGEWSHYGINGLFGDVQEQDSYLSLPLVIILYGFARGNWGDGAIRWLSVALVVVTVLSWGPALWVAGHWSGVPMPWRLFMNVPLVRDLLPARFALAAWLVVAVLAGFWLQGRTGWGRAAWAVVICLTLVPSAYPRQSVPHAAFFAPGRVQAVLGLNPTILVLHSSINGPPSFWQVENGFGFGESFGYLGYPPAAMQRFAASQELFSGETSELKLDDLKTFLAATGTRFMVGGPGTDPAMLVKLAKLGWPTRRVDDATIITVPEARAP